MSTEANASTTIPGSMRREWVSAQAAIAGCVAVVLFAIVSTIGWSLAGADLDGLERIAFATPLVFAIAFAVRAIGTLPFGQPAGVGRAVLMDVAVVAAAVIFIITVGSIGDPSGFAIYSGSIMAMFLVPGTAVASLVVELVRRIPWLTRVAVLGAILAGVLALGIYARAITG
ncbi:hypothetical protein [Agromyces arachidis]|uniref:hypothetical protein n=1 Tax=Agromyces arachidis TaxID=766966 RepID=UPI0040575A9F